MVRIVPCVKTATSLDKVNGQVEAGYSDLLMIFLPL